MLRQHVLVMEFIGKEGYAAPRLKDANLSIEQLRECYLECVISMRTLYHHCRLVHADLSEYNLLYYKSHLYFIDVSQSVEHEHPNALIFLQMDCTNITHFFRKNGIAVMTTKELFDFITDVAITDDKVNEYLDKVFLFLFFNFFNLIL